MNNLVPAIRGKMGGRTYYSFSIEPERLLKIGYVLHRNDANRSMMPTYQRVIKKSRLKQVREFVDDGGYFPNSVIISIDAPRNGLEFDLKHGDGDDIAKLGILHLPKKYCSAYIIDGQHRLYGYSGSVYAETNTIPVVAFENLEKEEQIRLFMEINENQKAVPKNLRNTLSSDLLWTSESFAERRKALRLRVAEELGENQASPLYSRVLIGENKSTAVRCVTMDSIEKGLKAGRFLTAFGKNNQPINGQVGLFDNSEASNDYAFERLTAFLFAAFDYLKDELPDEWELGNDQEGILTNNVGIDAFLRVFSDIVVFYSDKGLISPRTQDAKTLVAKCKRFFDAIVDFYKNVTPETRSEIRHQLGGNGPVKHWRYLQRAIHERVDEFCPDGYDKWWADNSKQYNDDSREKLDQIIESTKSRVAGFMQEQKGDDWIEYALPVQLDDSLTIISTKENSKRKREGLEPLDKWDYADLQSCLEIANSGSYWSLGLKDILAEPGRRSRQGTKAAKTQWINSLNKIDSDLSKPGYSVSQSDYAFICAVYGWMVVGEEPSGDEMMRLEE